MDDITKGKTLRVNRLNERAVGFSICVLVGGVGLGGEGAALFPNIYNTFYVTLGY